MSYNIIVVDDELLPEARQNGASGSVSKMLPLEQLLMEIHRVIKYGSGAGDSKE